MNLTKKSDFIEIKFTGYQDGKVFDSNVEEDLKILNPEAKPEKTIVVIGQGMVVKGLDKALEGKELNKEYEVNVPYKEGFGERRRELVKTIPLRIFTEQKINPKPGATLFLDNNLARIITVSGARVMTDFNNPLAGKDLVYKFKILKFVNDEKEKVEAVFRFFLRFVPDFEINETKVTIKGKKELEGLVSIFKEKFKEIMSKDLDFKEEKELEETPKTKE